MKTYLRSIFIIFFCLLFYASSDAQVTINITSTCGSGQACDTYVLKAQGIRAAFNDQDGPYRIFWSVGDGYHHDYVEYLNDGNPDAEYTYTFSRNTAHSIYVEAVPLVYEDNKPPPKRFNYSSNGSSTFTPNCSSCTPFTATLDDYFKHTTNRNFVPGDKVSYLLTYFNDCTGSEDLVNGTIRFKFPTDYLSIDTPTTLSIYDPTSVVQFSSIPPAPLNSPVPGGQVEMIWRFNGLNVQQLRHIIIPLRVDKSAPLGHPFGFEIFVNMQNANKRCVHQKTFKPRGIVKNSHDPNDLLSDKIFTCDTIDINTVRYVIRFRNDGDGDADSVLIKNVIPDFFDSSTIQTIYPVYAGDALQHTFTRGIREARWDVRGGYLKGGNRLKGRMDPNFGKNVFAEDCVDSVVYIITKAENEEIKECNAIVNQAEIIFDCNPSFYTPPYIFRFGCLDTINGFNPVPLPACDSCSEISIVRSDTLFTSPNVPSVSLEVDPTKLPASGNLEYRWYPSIGLDDYRRLQPVASPTKSTDYYLVVSTTDPCRRSIFHIRVDVSCDLEISHKITCTQSGGKRLLATVNSNSPHLKWQDCSLNDSFEISGIGNKYFYLSVVDTITNCSATKKVEMICPPPKIPWWTWGIIALAVALVAGYILNNSGWPP